MVTKAELEAEVAELRRQLAQQTKADKAEPKEDHSDSLIDTIESWSDQMDEVLTELGELPHKKPILFALGVFALGYLIGRSR